jgi:hypothetical protein
MHPVDNAKLQLVCVQTQDRGGALSQIFGALCRLGNLAAAKLAANDTPAHLLRQCWPTRVGRIGADWSAQATGPHHPHPCPPAGDRAPDERHAPQMPRLQDPAGGFHRHCRLAGSGTTYLSHFGWNPPRLRSHRTGLIGEARRSPQMTFRSAATAAETWLFVTLSGALPIPEQSGRLGLRQAVRLGLRGERATPAKRYAQALRRELPGRAGGSGLARAPAAGGSGSRRRLHFAPRLHWLWRDDTDVIFPL